MPGCRTATPAYAAYLYERLQRKGYLQRDCQRLVNQDRNPAALCRRAGRACTCDSPAAIKRGATLAMRILGSYLLSCLPPNASRLPSTR